MSDSHELEESIQLRSGLILTRPRLEKMLEMYDLGFCEECRSMWGNDDSNGGSVPVGETHVKDCSKYKT